ncbi:DUF4214 domain-containing protein [Marivita sp.]|uniref:DUF4214 domain-containing protein n=1 Tax=Marivita sp. TaxID=2003365 RepID=UPI003A83B241
MRDISDFWLYLSVKDPRGLYRDIRDSGIDLVILESGNTSRTEGVNPSLTMEELQALKQAGQTVIGYVNVAVPDFNRTYWQDDWVTPSEDDQNDLDFGTINPSAPAWLDDNFGTAEGPEVNGDGTYGFIVDYSDMDWQSIVIDQAVTLIEAGYGGIFLDDVGRYYEAALQNRTTSEGDLTQQEAEPFARDMIDLVNTVTSEIRAIDPNAYIVVNGGAYLKFDSDSSGSYPGFVTLRNALDGLMIENTYIASTVPLPDATVNPWPDAADNYSRQGEYEPVEFFAVEWATSLSALQEQDFLTSYAPRYGLIPMLSPTSAYDTPPPINGSGVEMSISDGAVFRLYDAIFDRAPDPAGFHFWSGLLERNVLDLFEMADQFILSPEFQQTFGLLEDAAFLTAIYQNVLDRTPDNDGYAFWLNALDVGVTRAELVIGFSESTEFKMTTEAELGTWFDVWG